MASNQYDSMGPSANNQPTSNEATKGPINWPIDGPVMQQKMKIMMGSNQSSQSSQSEFVHTSAPQLSSSDDGHLETDDIDTETCVGLMKKFLHECPIRDGFGFLNSLIHETLSSKHEAKSCPDVSVRSKEDELFYSVQTLFFFFNDFL